MRQLPPRVRTTLHFLAPLALAGVAVGLDSQLMGLAAIRPGILPAAVFTLLAGVLVTRVRHWLIVTLCYVFAFMALRDAVYDTPLPGVHEMLLDRTGWAIIAIVAAAAGLVESIRPRSVWARRCYFASAALYLLLHGLSGLVRHSNWGSVILLATGLTALIGIFLADRIVASEATSEPDEDDMRELAELPGKRSAALAAREWRDSADGAGAANSG